MMSKIPVAMLLDELWQRLSDIIDRISAAVGSVDSWAFGEVAEDIAPEIDWYSGAADIYLKQLDAELRGRTTGFSFGSDGALRPIREGRGENDVELEDDVGDLHIQRPPGNKRALQSTLSAITEAISKRDSDDVRVLVDELITICELVAFQPDGLLIQADRTVRLLKTKVSSLLYLPPKPPVYIPQLLIESNEILIRELSLRPRRLFDISPRKFEEIIAELFFRAGYEVELTAQTRDGGRDIIALSRRMDVPLRLLIECKRYAPHNKVGLALVQRLFGVKLAESASKAILATTSTFTRDAQVFARSHLWDLDLKDHNGVVAWLRKYPNMTA